MAKALVGLAETLDKMIVEARASVANAHEFGDAVSLALQTGNLEGLEAAHSAMVEVDLDEMVREWRTAPVELGKGGVKYHGMYVDPYELLLARIKEGE